VATTLMLGLDGATFDVLEPYWQDGTMPFLRAFVSRGVRAGLRSVVPPLTPCAWTALATGRQPGFHGVFDFVRITRQPGYLQSQMATSSDIRCDTIWSIAGRAGARVAALNFPVTFPPQPINGYVVPGFVPWRHLKRAVHPPSFYAELAALPDFDPRELLFDIEQERNAIQSLEQERYEEWILFHIRREERWLGVLRHLLLGRRCDLLAIVFDGVDKLQHICWRFIDPKLRDMAREPFEQKAVELCRQYFRRLDEILAEAVELAGEGARVFMASDHGFGPTQDILYVNTWLEQEGYLRWLPDVPVDDEGKVMLDSTRSPAALFDWSATRACSVSSGGNGLYIHLASAPDAPGVQPGEYVAFRDELRRKLLAIRHPITQQPVVIKASTREEAFPGPEMRNAPDLTLELFDSGFVSVLRGPEPVRRRTQIAGTHRPTGVFMARGPGIRQGVVQPDISIASVASMLLRSANVPTPPELLDGDAWSSWDAVFEEGFSGTPSTTAAAEPLDRDVMEDEHIQKRMRLLGY
jgi:predicted AlkP superfamily phosphohydrolase/phosphomutase